MFQKRIVLNTAWEGYAPPREWTETFRDGAYGIPNRAEREREKDGLKDDNGKKNANAKLPAGVFEVDWGYGKARPQRIPPRLFFDHRVRESLPGSAVQGTGDLGL
jgi:hypothetical protein